MPRHFDLPPRIAVPKAANEDEAADIAEAIADAAYDRCSPELNRIFTKLNPEVTKKVAKAAMAEERDGPADYIFGKIRLLSYAYLGYRSDIITLRDECTDRDINTGTISNILTELATVIGPKSTEHIYRMLTANIDTVLEERFGKGVALP